MKRYDRPKCFGIGGALLAGLAMMLAAPVSAMAQTNPPGEKKGEATAKPNAGKEPMGPVAPRRRAVQPAQRPAKPVNRNQVPEPTVKLKPGEAPAIKFDMMTYDFGRIRAGDDVIHDYYFSNTGTGPLEILRVKPG